MGKRIQTHCELRIYENAFPVLFSVLERSRNSPTEERDSLTDPMRRSSRSVVASIADAWRKGRYRTAFLARQNDAESEAAETQVWVNGTDLSTKTIAILCQNYETKSSVSGSP